MTTPSDVWACAACRSINTKRAGRCYSCYTPRAASGMALADVPVVGSLPAVPVLKPYRGSALRAAFVTLAIVAFAIAVGAYWWHMYDEFVVAGPAYDGHDDAFSTFFYAVIATLVGTLFAYGTWISRVVDNLPAIGLGYSRVTPRTAFLETLIVGRNLLTLRARIVEVLEKVDPEGRGQSILAAATIALVVPLVPMTIVRLSFFRTIHDRAIDISTIGLVGFGVQIVGFILGIALIWRVERRCRALATGTPAVGTARGAVGQPTLS